MAFPTSPTNGQAYTLNGKTYVWSSANGVWVVSTATSQIPTFLATSGGTITGNLAVTDTITGNLSSTTATITTLNNGLHQNGNSNIGIAANGNVTISATGTANVVSVANTGVTVAGNIAITQATGPQISLNGATSNWISINAVGVAPPAFTTRSAGSKVVLYETIGAASAGFAIGVESSAMWHGVDTNTSGFKWYGGTTLYANLQNGSLTMVGNILPSANVTYNLGSAAARWSTVFTGDLDLSNGIGDWTIVEGEEDLFIYNNKKNKVYKFNLIEVDPAIAPPKKGD